MLPDRKSFSADVLSNGLCTPHFKLDISKFVLLSQFFNSLIWKTSPEWDEHDNAICFEFNLKKVFAFVDTKGIAWNILIADLGKVISLSFFVEKTTLFFEF